MSREKKQAKEPLFLIGRAALAVKHSLDAFMAIAKLEEKQEE